MSPLGALEPESWATHFVAPWTVSDVAFGAGRFVAAADVCYTSRDGVVWTPRPMDQPPQSGLRGIAFGNGRFVAVAAGAAYVSTDGTTWERSADLPKDNPLPVIKRVEFGVPSFSRSARSPARRQPRARTGSS